MFPSNSHEHHQVVEVESAFFDAGNHENYLRGLSQGGLSRRPRRVNVLVVGGKFK
jgi:hypothetical protein